MRFCSFALATLALTLLLSDAAQADSALMRPAAHLRRAVPTLKRSLLQNPRLPQPTLRKILASEHLAPYLAHLLPAIENLAGTPGLDKVLKNLSAHYKESHYLRGAVFETVALAHIALRLQSMSFSREGYELDGQLRDGTIVSVKSTTERSRHQLIKRAEAELGRQVQAGTEKALLIVGHEPIYRQGFEEQGQWRRLSTRLGVPLEVILVDQQTAAARTVFASAGDQGAPSAAQAAAQRLLPAPRPDATASASPPEGERPSAAAKAAPRSPGTQARWRRKLAQGIIKRYAAGFAPAALLGSKVARSGPRQATPAEKRRYRAWSLRLHPDRTQGMNERDVRLLSEAFNIASSAYRSLGDDSSQRLYQLDQNLAVSRASKARAAEEQQRADQAAQRATAAWHQAREEHRQRSAQTAEQRQFSKTLGAKRQVLDTLQKRLGSYQRARRRGQGSLDEIFFLRGLLARDFAPILQKSGKLHRSWDACAKESDKAKLAALHSHIEREVRAAAEQIRGVTSEAQTLLGELQARSLSRHEARQRWTKLQSAEERQTRSQESVALNKVLQALEAELDRQERQSAWELKRATEPSASTKAKMRAYWSRP